MQVNTLAPVWNELWKIKNVPSDAKLYIDVMDKDNGTVTDDFIGAAEIGVAAGAHELTLETAGPSFNFRRARGTMWIKVRLMTSSSSIFRLTLY